MSSAKRNVQLSPKLKLGVGRGSKNLLLKFSGILFLVAALGLTANAVRLIIHGNKQETAIPQVLGATDIKTVDSSTNVQFIEYKVQKGDTLFNVSQQFNISWGTLATLNNLESPFTLKTGQIIKIPK